MNLTTFRSNISQMLGVENNASTDQPLIDNYVNEGYRDVLLRTSCTVSKDTVTTTAGEGDYDLDTSIMKIKEMWISSDGSDFSLEPATMSEIIQWRLNASSISPPMMFAIAGANKLMLYPIPDDASVITLYHVAVPTALSTGANSPVDVPTQWHKLIEWYACWRIADFDDDSTSQQGERYKKMYEEGIKEFRRVINTKGGARQPPARLRHRYIPRSSDPSRSWH